MERQIENNIERSLYSDPKEKTFIDKVLGVKNAERVTTLIKKSPLEREDLNELYSYLNSPEQKLYNFDERTMHIVLKYYVWVNDFVKITQNFYDYNDFLEKNKDVCDTCGKKFSQCKCLPIKYEKFNTAIKYYNNQLLWIDEKFRINQKKLKLIPIKKPKILVTKHFEQIFKNTRVIMENNVKFLVSLYFNVCRSTLSMNGVGFSDILSNKYEVDYKNAVTSTSSHIDSVQNQKKSFLNFGNNNR